MVNKCGVVSCNGNYNEENKCRLFKLPADTLERQRWIEAIPPRQDFVINPETYRICERHWKSGYAVKGSGKKARPVEPPTEFNVKKSCFPTPKPPPRKTNAEDRQLAFWRERDSIKAFSSFKPESELKNKYHNKNVISTRTSDQLVFVFMKDDFSESEVSVIVDDKKTLTCALIVTAFKRGIRVPLGKILHPNNGVNSMSQFFEAVHIAVNFEPHCDSLTRKVVDILKSHSDSSDCCGDNVRKLSFLTHQLELLINKQYSVSDYCFAIESFPHCNYEILREYLVLPSRRKLQSVISSVDTDYVLKATFDKMKIDQQKYVFLLVDEVKIRPTVAFAGGVLSGMAKNDENSKATSMLCVMMKALHRGPSVMISVTPVHRLTAHYQYGVVMDAAARVEKAGGHVLGSITDNHKVNQQYCCLFVRDSKTSAVAKHPLSEGRTWFLLFDTVHLLKCIRNNWITEKTQEIKLEDDAKASFEDIVQLYKEEKDNILKTTPLTRSSVFPSNLQLQNVKHVLRVFNDKVVAALRLRGCSQTAIFVERVLNWWKTVNVSGKGQDQRLNDPHHSVQEKDSTSLDTFVSLFQQAESGQGASRVKCLTHDTKKALIQTMEGLKAVCSYLLNSAGFNYVVLREIQSDRLEGEFGVYRQTTGANSLMTPRDVFSASQKRLAKHAASFLESVEVESVAKEHTCLGISITLEDAASMEICTAEIALTTSEESSSAYVAGWLESKCGEELCFTDEEPLVTSEAKDFIHEVSRGKFKTPHACTFELVRIGLSFVKKARHRACCRKRLTDILSTLASFNDIDIRCDRLFRHLSNVLFHGLQNLVRDQEKDAVLLQTSVKRARMI